jgi:hypothetical protein
MPTKPRGKAKRWPNETVPSQFRLGPDTLADLDAVARHLESEGLPHSRADALRYAARQAARGLEKIRKTLPE